MGFFESVFYVIWRGIAIGILISAPMGPVGILCIQRTLDKGRRQGFFTGVGASISDLFYCILTGFGLSFIEDFLERNHNVIQLVGSAVLIGFSVYLFKKNPASSLKKPVEQAETSPKKSVLGGFLFTFSNPLILFLIIGLFARFNFTVPEISVYYYIVGFAAIFIGALAWWKFVTFSVDKLRAHFNLRSMWLINRIIGVVILLFAIVGIVTGVTSLSAEAAEPQTKYWNIDRGYSDFLFGEKDGVRIHNTSSRRVEDVIEFFPSENINLMFRASNLNGGNTKKYPYMDENGVIKKQPNTKWGFFLITESNDTIRFEIGATEIQGMLSVNSHTHISLSAPSDIQHDNTEYICTETDSQTGTNLWHLKVTPSEIKLSGGHTKQTPILSIPNIHDHYNQIGFYAEKAANLKITDISLSIEPSAHKAKGGIMRTDYVQEIISQSNDPIEGYWMIFDRDLEESLLKPGGEYVVAIIREEDEYKLIYLAGSVINSQTWKAGMTKGIFHFTPFKHIFDTEWIDADGQTLSNGVKAQFLDDDIITIQFPYHSSSLRLRKVQNPEYLKIKDISFTHVSRN